MNFERARELSFLVKWKVAECFSGPQCWCRRIVPVEPILLYTYTESSDYEEEYEIVGDASIDQKTAEYIVRLHNENYERVQQSCRDAMKETIDSMIPINEREMVETFEKLWENKHSKIRKIVRKEID
jgi:hypothetical protein